MSSTTTTPTSSQSTGTTKIERRGLAKSNYSQDSEDGVNQIVHALFEITEGLCSMSFYFRRTDNSKFGFGEFYDDLSREYYWMARSLMDYQIIRGGAVCLSELNPPEHNMEWNSGVDSLNHVLKRLKDLNDKIHQLHQTAYKNDDPCLTNFLEHHFISKVVNDLLRVSNKLVSFTRAGTSGLPEYVTDRDLKLMVEDVLDDVGATETDEDELIPNL